MYEEGAKPVDALVTKELLVSIFTPGGPLHDGAVIVRGNRIVAANAFLPLTTTPDPKLAHGTRHRAAIGLSEESDAFVIVISEENGSIAVTGDGVLREHLDRTNCGHMLQERFGAPRMKNLGLKFVSLLLACILWWYVLAPRREQVRERIVTASLSLVGVPPSLVITTPDIASSVSVRVRGRKSDLRALASQSLEASADLSSINKPGEVEITIRAQHINVPEEIEVVSIEPNKVRFRVEQLRQRAVPIRPFLEGTVPAGFIVGQATAEPALALVPDPPRRS